MKILHSADWHLKDSSIDEAEICLTKIIETTASKHVDLIIIAGDIFDSRDIKLDSLAARSAIKTISSLADIAPVAIVTGTPSHDGAAPEILKYARGKHDIFVSSRPQQVYLEDGYFFDRPAGDREPQCIVTLIPQPTKQFFRTSSDIKTSDQEIGAAMSQIFAGFGAMAAEYDAPHFLVYHGEISGATISNGQTLTGQDIQVSIEQLNLCQACINLLGHIHLPQQIGDNTFYAGSIYAKDWGETHRHGFYLHEIDGNHLVTSRFIETPTRKMLHLKHNFVEDPPLDELDIVLYSLEREDIENAYIRCDFTVYQDEAETIDKEMIRAFYARAGALDVDVRIIRIPRETIRSEEVLKVERLRDKLIAMAELRGETVTESILQKADDLENMPSEELIGTIAGEKVEAAA